MIEALGFLFAAFLVFFFPLIASNFISKIFFKNNTIHKKRIVKAISYLIFLFIAVKIIFNYNEIINYYEKFKHERFSKNFSTKNEKISIQKFRKSFTYSNESKSTIFIIDENGTAYSLNKDSILKWYKNDYKLFESEKFEKHYLLNTDFEKFQFHKDTLVENFNSNIMYSDKIGGIKYGNNPLELDKGFLYFNTFLNNTTDKIIKKIEVEFEVDKEKKINTIYITGNQKKSFQRLKIKVSDEQYHYSSYGILNFDSKISNVYFE